MLSLETKEERKAYYEKYITIKEQIKHSVWINPTNGIELNREKTDHIRLPYKARFVVKYCDDCGTASYGVWRYSVKEIDHQTLYKTHKSVYNLPTDFKYEGEYPEIFKEDEKAVENMTQCPLCGGRLRSIFLLPSPPPYFAKSMHNFYNVYEKGKYVNGYFSQQNVEESLDVVIRVDLPADVYIHDYAAAAKKAEENLKSWDNPTPLNTANIEHQIVDSPKKLMEYLLHLIHLESSIYGLSQRLEPLYFNAIQLKRRAFCEANVSLPLLEKNVKEIQEALTALKDLPPVEIPPVSYPQKPEKPSEPSALSKFFGITTKKNQLSQVDYKYALMEYERECTKCEEEEKRLKVEADKEIESREAEVKEKERKLKKILSLLEQLKTIARLPESPVHALYMNAEKEIAEVEKLLREMMRARNELYAYNVVHTKYRNIVALTTFYEYLSAGRCTSLEGTNGAYNIYENEVRMNTIVSQLSTVIEELDSIRQGQYMLYTELQSINSGISMLNSKMDAAIQSLDSIESNTSNIAANTSIIAENTDRIAYNTEVTAFYSKKNAELTDALGYMVAFK